jgi:hypothetical protein
MNWILKRSSFITKEAVNVIIRNYYSHGVIHGRTTPFTIPELLKDTKDFQTVNVIIRNYYSYGIIHGRRYN